MAVTCGDIALYMEKLAPPDLAEDWDNVGFLLGRRQKTVSRILVALDAIDEVIEEAVGLNADMIITHHPILFKPIDRITDDNPLGKRLLRVLEQGIAVYAAHTNLDTAWGGTNDALAACLGLRNVEPILLLDEAPSMGLGRKGILPKKTTLDALSVMVKERLSLPAVRYVGDGKQKVQTVGICTGSASGLKYFTGAVAAGCEVYITGDIRFHEAQDALSMGLPLIDATHYASEAVVIPCLVDGLRDAFGPAVVVTASAVDGQVFRHVL